MDEVNVEEEVKTKRCPKCERFLPITEFNKSKSRKDGLQCYCKECIRAKVAQYYQSNKDKIAEYRQANKDAIRKQQAEYYQANKDAIRKQQAEYRQANKDAIRKQQAEYRQANKDAIRKQQAEYYQANKDAIRKQQAEYYQANKDKIADYYNPQTHPLNWAKNMVNRYRWMDRERFGDDSKTITAEWFLKNIAYKPCAHCGKQGIGLIGCNRLDNSKGHTEDNVEAACFKCNCKENNRDQIARGIHISQIRKKQSFKDFVNEHKAKDKNLS